MICNCGGLTRHSSWETADGWKHWAETCPACGRYFRWPSRNESTGEEIDWQAKEKILDELTAEAQKLNMGY